MRRISCLECNDYDPLRRGSSKKGDIRTMYDTVTHKDGRKERRIYAVVNEETNQILETHFLGDKKQEAKP